ncbi:hypothetical protein SAMN02910406_03718 [Ruminococcus albus]|uniref:Uncharacterized protein n=1 Tax=Ruminococcus albus TaxID=1264 RepID=A0A1I1RVQ5_RUMAL|nr:hypothetical protein SAMN02910406_03718 [Ruminococcus albus]
MTSRQPEGCNNAGAISSLCSAKSVKNVSINACTLKILCNKKTGGPDM